MRQIFFICHLEAPRFSKRASMIAPPMIRVQEHYNSIYPDQEDFVKAIKAFVKSPSEAKTLMPGAIRKFDIMTQLPYDDAELEQIAEVLHETDFGNIPKMKMGMSRKLLLNDGKKWKVKQQTSEQIQAIIDQLNSFQSDNLADYQHLGRSVFDDAKSIMLDDSYTGDLFDQIHSFFYTLEGNMHLLITSKTLDEARLQRGELKIKFEVFTQYFEHE